MTDGLTLNQLAEKNALLVSDVEQLNKKLLAYEKAAKNEVALPEALKYAEIYGRAFICVDRSGSVHAVDPSQITLTILNEPAQPVSEPYKLPDGWKLVPLEPTAEMAQAARDCHEGESFLPYSIYRAMLAAAPAQESE